MGKINHSFTFRNGLELRNPVVMAPMTTWSGEEDGRLSQEELEYYRARCNGVGMVITATTYMTRNGQGFPGQFFGGSDECLPHLTLLADTIKQGGARAVLQIFHAGRSTGVPALIEGHEVVSASNIPLPREGAPVPRALTEAEIAEVIESFAQVTERAIKAGFDGVEIHGANTYLIQQFFSPHSNRREDDWGGSLEKRARFPLAIVDAVLGAVAKHAAKARPGFVVGYRFSPEELEQPGITLDDTAYLIERLAETRLDYLHLSLKHYATNSVRDPQAPTVVGKWVAELLQGRMPLIGVGQIHTEGDLNAAFDLGYDLMAVGKSLIYDPQWFEKIAHGEYPAGALSEKTYREHLVPHAMFQALSARRTVMNVRFE